MFFSKDIWYNMKIFYTVVIDNLNMIFVKMSLKLCRFFLDLIENKTLSIINLVLLENITSSLLMSLIKSVESDNCIHFCFHHFQIWKILLISKKGVHRCTICEAYIFTTDVRLIYSMMQVHVVFMKRNKYIISS